MSGNFPISHKSPALGPTPNYSTAIYPDPPSHDFCVWLITAELSRLHHQSPPPLQVKFGLINNQLGLFDFSHHSIMSGQGYKPNLPAEYYHQMLKGVLRPAIHMIGARELSPINITPLPPNEISEFVEYDHHLFPLVDAARAGYHIPRWQINQPHKEEIERLFPERPIVITLRETGWQPERNSNLNAWLGFARHIKHKYRVVFVRDTSCAFSLPFQDIATFLPASTNAYCRAALYNHAILNMMVCNGPNVWVMFSKAPYLIFKQLIPELPLWDHGQPKGWREQDHLEVDQQLPWATPSQRFTWKDDTFENILEEFEAWEAQQ